jgi:hypothetical protein
MLLRVSGTPNWWKPGAIGLEGIVETFWSPYTFTMNWRLTHPGACIQFDKGDPICFIQPADPASVEHIEPRIRPIDEQPDLKAEHEAWCAARRELNENPNRGKDWQKNYFQGKRMCGDVEPEHRSRVDAKPFKTGGG